MESIKGVEHSSVVRRNSRHPLTIRSAEEARSS